MKKKLTIILIVAAEVLIAAAIALYFCVIQPAGVYQTAVEKMEAEDYEEAAELFHELGEYKDSDALEKLCEELMAKEALYQQALKRLKANDLPEAMELFAELGDYKDSPQYLSRFAFVCTNEIHYGLQRTYFNEYNEHGQLIRTIWGEWEEDEGPFSPAVYDSPWGETVYTYDSDGNLISSVENNGYLGYTLTTVYNTYGDPVSIEFENNNNPYLELYEYTYFENGEIETCTVSWYDLLDGGVQGDFRSSEKTTYQENGNYLVEYNSEVSSSYQMEVTVDAYGNDTKRIISNKDGTQTIYTFENQYDDEGNLISRANPGFFSYHYEYDDYGNQIAWYEAATLSMEYIYELIYAEPLPEA